MVDPFDIDALIGPQPEPDTGLDEDENEPLIYDELSENLCFDFEGHPLGQAFLKATADFIVVQYNASRDANREYLDRCARDWRIFSGDLSKKTVPFKDAANGHVPIMLENISRLSFRAKDELFGNWQNVVRMMPTGADDREQADILSRHQNWQLPKIPGMKREQDRGLLIFFTFGEVACHSYWDAASQSNRHDILSPEQITTPYVYVSTAIDYSDCPWVAKMMMMYRHELEAMRGVYSGVDDVLSDRPPEWEADPEKRITEALAEARGISLEEERRESMPYQLIWWEGWLSLPNQTDQRHCQCILEYRSRRVLKLIILEKDDWQDRIRYERQVQELNQYRTARAQYMQQEQGMLGYMESATNAIISGAVRETDGPDVEAGMMAALQEASMAPLPPPPDPPAWLINPDDPAAQPEPPRRVPARMFSHQACIEPLQGSLGLGLGRIEADYNRGANTALNQAMDQATLGNAKTFVATTDVSFKEPFMVGPGRINYLANFSGDLTKVMMPLDFGPANPQLIEFVKEFRNYGQAATQVSEVISGFPGKSGEPFKGLAARLEAASKSLSVPTRKYADFFEQVVRNNCELNSHFLRDEELFEVTNDMYDVTQYRVTRDMYRRDYNVSVVADLRFTSQAQRVQEADEVIGMVNSHPMLATNKALVYAVYKDALEARGKKALVQLLGPPPAPGEMLPLPGPPPKQGAAPE